MEYKNARSVYGDAHHDTHHFVTRFLIIFSAVFFLLGSTTKYVFADDDVLIVEETVEASVEEVITEDPVIVETPSASDNSGVVPGVSGSGTIVDATPTTETAAAAQTSNDTAEAVAGVTGSNDANMADTAVAGVTGNNDPVPGVTCSNDPIADDSPNAIAEDAVLGVTGSSEEVSTDSSDGPEITDTGEAVPGVTGSNTTLDDPNISEPGSQTDTSGTTDNSGMTGDQPSDDTSGDGSDTGGDQEISPDEPVPGVTGEGTIIDPSGGGGESDSSHEESGDSTGGSENTRTGNEDSQNDPDTGNTDVNDPSGGDKDTDHDSSDSGDSGTDNSSGQNPNKDTDTNTPDHPNDTENTDDPDNPSSDDSSIPTGGGAADDGSSTVSPDEPTNDGNTDDTDVKQGDSGTDQTTSEDDDTGASPHDQGGSEEVPDEILEVEDTVADSQETETEKDVEAEAIPVSEDETKAAADTPDLVDVTPVIPGVSGSGSSSYSSGSIYTSSSVVSYLNSFHAWYSQLSSFDKLLVGMKQIGKKYAVTKAPISVTNTKSTGGIEVGTLPSSALCFIITEVDDVWVFIESGEVRGFVLKDQLITGYSAEKIVGETGEADMPIATATLSPTSNSAFRYALMTTTEVPKQPAAVTATTSTATLGGVQNGNSADTSDAVTSVSTTIQVSDLTETGKLAAAGDADAQQEIIEALAQATESEWGNYGLSRSFLIAQTIEESEWLSCSADEQVENGITPEDNNVLAMNADLQNSQWESPWDGTESERTIVTQSSDGETNYQTESMRTYTDLSSAMEDYAAYKTSLHPELVGETDIDQVLNTAMRGYANDTSYQSSIKQLINQYDLTQYDVQTAETNETYVSNLLSNTTTMVGRTDASQYTQEQLELIWAIVAQEDDNSYEGALAVITSAMNRADVVYGGHGTSALLQLTADGQYCYSASVSDPIYYQRRLNGNVPDYVKQAVSDCLNKGIRNHSYLNFRSHNSTGNRVKIGGNYYY